MELGKGEERYEGWKRRVLRGVVWRVEEREDGLIGRREVDVVV